MRNTLVALSALLLILFASSCGKKNKLNGPYTFENQTGETINLRMYKTLDDYASSSNPTLAVRMAPGDSYQWNYTDPDEMLQKDKTFYMDWYNDDYKMSNWMHFRPRHVSSAERPPYYVFTRQRYGSRTHVITPYLHSNIRSVLIKGNEKEVSWKVVNIFNSNTRKSVWDSLDIGKQNCELRVSKDLKASFKTSELLITTNQMSFFYVNNDQHALIGPDGDGQSATVYLLGSSTWDRTASEDTVLLYLENHYYHLVQKK